ncbi:hypothetical protein JW752_04400 [Candidatus Peregrinibacteria bacterium]|nr:hypothetical protein [Candidatus Peregrinibacteria bacterium]
MRRPSEKPTKHLPTRTLIGLVLMTFGCAAADKTIKEETTQPAPVTKKQAAEKPCPEQLREAMELCIDMCRMRNIGAIGEFNKTACDKQCENGTSEYPEKLKNLFKECGKKPEKNGQQPYQNPRKKWRARRRVA